MQYRAAWLIGSYADLPEFELMINAVNQPFPEGSYYLYDHVDAGLSLLTHVRNAIFAATGQLTTAIVQKNGHVRIDSAAPFSLAWGAATLLRDLLGFDDVLALNASYTAPNISPLLWMPGKPETPLAQRLGVIGHRTHAAFQTTAPYSGKSESVSHGVRSFARYAFPMVDTDRMVGELGEGGTYDTWFEWVAVRSARWKLYRDVLESASGAEATESALLTLTEPLGPYIVTGPKLGWKWDLSRGFERTDKRADLEIACHVCEEFP